MADIGLAIFAIIFLLIIRLSLESGDLVLTILCVMIALLAVFMLTDMRRRLPSVDSEVAYQAERKASLGGSLVILAVVFFALLWFGLIKF